MIENPLIPWLSLGGIAAYIDVSTDTVLRRAIPWQDLPVRGKIRFKHLKLGDGTRQERRYYAQDATDLLN